MNDNWYVFFVKTGQEAKAADEIETFFPEEIKPRVLFAETLFKKNGIVMRKRQVVFPGYVFVTSKLDNERFIIQCRNLVLHSKAFLRILRYGDTGRAALQEEDVQLLNMLWADQNCLEVSIGIIEGDRVKVIKGPFAGKESLIKKINRHKRQAVIEIPFMGENRLITVGLEIIAKS